MTERTNWSLHRVGWIETNYILHEHLDVVTVGRNYEANKQCLGRQISRRHCELRPVESPTDRRIYWTARDLGSSGKTYINGAPIPPNRDIQLNDRDLISLGQCIDREEARDQKRSFLYQVHAPTDWSELGGGHVGSDEETDDGAGGGISDETVSAADSPPPDAAAVQVVQAESPLPHNLPDVVKNINKEEETPTSLESSSSSVEVVENAVPDSESVEEPLGTEPTPSTSKASVGAKPAAASTSKSFAAKRKASIDEMGGHQHKKSKGEVSDDDEDDDDALFSHVRGKSIKGKNVRPKKSLKSSQAELEREKEDDVVVKLEEEEEEEVEEKEDMKIEEEDEDGENGDDDNVFHEDEDEDESIWEHSKRASLEKMRRKVAYSEKAAIERVGAEIEKELEMEGDFAPQKTSSRESTKRDTAKAQRGHRYARLMDSSEDEHDEDLLNVANRNQARSLRGQKMSDIILGKVPKVTLARLEPPRGTTSALISADGKSILRWMRWTVHKMNSPDALNEPLFEYEGDDVNVKDEVSSGSSNQKKKKLSELSGSDSSSPLVSSHADESSLEEGEIGEIKRGKTIRKKKKIKRSIGKSFGSSSSEEEEEGGCEPSLSTKGLNFSQVEEVIEIDDSDSEYFHSSQSNVKVKDEIADDADADDYDEAREEGEVEDEGDDAGNDDDEITGQGSPMLVDSDAEEEVVKGGEPCVQADDDQKSVADMDDEEFDDFALSQDSLMQKVCNVIKKGRGEGGGEGHSAEEQEAAIERGGADIEKEGEKEEDCPSQSLLPDSGSDMDWYAFPSDEDSDGASKSGEKETTPPGTPPVALGEEKEERLQKEPQPKAPSRSSKLIDPLPHPPRRKFSMMNRGTSEKKASELVDRRSTSVPEVKTEARESKEDLKKKRTLALKELAERDQRNDQGGADRKMGPPPALKVKQSVSKVHKLMEVDIFKPTKREEAASVKAAKQTLRNNFAARPKPPPVRASPSSSSSSSSSSPPKQSPSKVEDAQEDDKPKPLPKVAATRVDEFGDKRIAKMTFRNVVRNIHTQDIVGDEGRSEATETPVRKREKKRLTWRDQVISGGSLTEVREIDLVGKGRAVKDQRAFDAAQCLVRRRQLIPPPPLTPRRPPLPMQLPPPPPAPARPGTLPTKPSASYYAVLRQVLSWRPAWLAEQENNSDPPPVSEQLGSLCHVTPLFKNYQNYCNTFYPLMLLELWEHVYRDYTAGWTNQVIACVTNVVNKPEAKLNEIVVLGFITDVEKRNGSISDGWLCKLEMRYSMGPGKKDRIKPCFGLVDSYKIRKRYKNSDTEALYAKRLEEANIAKKRRQLRHVVEMHLTIKRINLDDGQLNVQKPIIVQGVCRIGPDLRLFRAVDQVRDLPLFKSVLAPRPEKFYIGSGTEDFAQSIRDKPAIKNLNEVQSRVVKSVARMCTTNIRDPQLSLIQGPPGTGKTSTIAGLILQIVHRWNLVCGNGPIRILVTAPSNAAVDEIARRLMRQGLRMIRIGRDKVIHPEVLPIQAEKLRDIEIDSRVKRSGNRESVEMEVKARQQTLNQLGEELVRLGGMSPLIAAKAELITRKVKEEQVLLERAKRAMADSENRLRNELRGACMRDVFVHAQIVLATLNSSLNGQMEHQARFMSESSPTKRPFEVAIVDEASQSVEPEMLIPMQLGFTKLVLVGDPEQLPATVVSQKAKKLSYHFSMFSRLFKHFANTPQNNPTTMLEVQYRMHPEIAKWPSCHFYGDKLKNGPQNRTSSFLRPYALLDSHKVGREQRSGPLVWNTGEVEFIGRLIDVVIGELKQRNERLSIGVITFYARQREFLEKEMKRLGHADAVLVKTVDAFQGSECDLIVISCVRTESIGFVAESERLNVALTRARSALYVVGNFYAFEGNPMWKSLVSDAKARRVIHSIREARNAYEAGEEIRRLIYQPLLSLPSTHSSPSPTHIGALDAQLLPLPSPRNCQN